MIKMHKIYQVKEERENGNYLRRVLRSARKRERPERWSDERERGGERELFGGEEMKKKESRRRNGLLLIFKKNHSIRRPVVHF